MPIPAHEILHNASTLQSDDTIGNTIFSKCKFELYETSLHRFTDSPLGIFTTAIKSIQESFIQSSHILFVLDTASSERHSTRSHGYAKLTSKSPNGSHSSPGIDREKRPRIPDEVVVLFGGSYHQYFKPKLYTETKPAAKSCQHGITAPCKSAARYLYNAIPKSEETGSFLKILLEDLMLHAETSIIGFTGSEREHARSVDKTPKA
ncbi:transcriptional regulator [Penicillium taxi]|uniref:transcriptional regulator n=1 Tax=Penicillium taxi TaxID=168475 RepID=UPI0025452820|nr:transcriptional regulator [Penicillium taxi]KAJ5895140.1 transcriptional regulator [Penicillium taxi]